MPGAAQTPLGRQLRSVLAHLCRGRDIHCPRPPQATRTEPIGRARSPWESAPPPASPCERRAYHASTVAVPEAAEMHEIDAHAPEHPSRNMSEPGLHLNRRHLYRRVRVSRITEAFSAIGRSELLPSATKRPNGLYLNFRSRDGHQTRRANLRRCGNDFIPPLAHSREVTSERILAIYIQNYAHAAEPGKAPPALPSASIRPVDAALLRAKGYSMHHVRHWAGIISPPDSLEAAGALQTCVATRGPRSIPLFVLLYLLRRPYISAQALRIITRQTRKILAHVAAPKSGQYVSEDTIFIIFIRLVRHARKVWPKALESLPEILFRYLPRVRSSGQDVPKKQLQTMTYMLNKAMRLITVPTAVKPIKNNRFQETAIIRILTFLAEHDPPLQINREGYRAVVVLQLAQPKRESEQQWAELKALSWPPWKEDRTAMDADITPDEHGVSKAVETLKRMEEAGYGHREWEKVASIYAGWDTDRTPTIQTLVILGTGVGYYDRFSEGVARWVARITTTRTAQEAWACFLAYEDEKLPASQYVYLAIFQKLYREDQRIRKEQRSAKGERLDNRRQLYSGDTQEIEPPPPSVHLHTYTRTKPPSVDQLYWELRERGVVFNGHCLAFLIAHANSLKLGINYLQHSMNQCPQLSRLLNPNRSNLSQLPLAIFAAFIELLSRFSNVRFPFVDGSGIQRQQFHPILQEFFDRRHQYPLNSNHAIVRAVNLLAERRPLFLPPWNSVLKYLAQENALQNINSLFIQNTNETPEANLAELEGTRGPITAYRIVRRVLRMMKANHLDLDVSGFHSQCLAVEHIAVSCWKALRALRLSHFKGDEDGIEPHVRSILDIMNAERNNQLNPSQQLRKSLSILVGDDSFAAGSILSEPRASERNDKLPRLLEMPSPAILHAYVRALGWMADFEGLLEAMHWMIAYLEDLRRVVEKDRNGEVMMRHILVAMRVFLERSWIPMTVSENDAKSIDAELEDGKDDVRMILHGLETPAPGQVIKEVRSLVESVEDWGGWADDGEVERYCSHARFQRFR